jgi:hypothetical protein
MTRKLIIRDRKADHELDINGKAAIFSVLDAIRETGRVNMFGAAPHLRNIMGEDEMTRRESNDWVKKYMEQKPRDRDLVDDTTRTRKRIKRGKQTE